MTEEPLNHQILPGNPCFGCGPETPHGLHVKIFRDPDDPGRLLGEYAPEPHVVGFPGIVHGGAAYSALDCMATWSGMMLRRTKAMWVLRSASTTYHRPAFQGRPLALSATIEESGGDWDAIRVRADARDADGELLVEGSFKVIPLTPERFQRMTGIETLPAGWSDWLADDGA